MTFFAPRAVQILHRPDGSILLHSPQMLGDYGRRVGDWLLHWATNTPARPFLKERRADGSWAGVTYGEALHQVKAVAAWLLRNGCCADRPLGILSDNSVGHGLITLAAMHVGVPVAPISSAYSLLSSDHGKLKEIIKLLRPGAIYVADGARFGPALAAIHGLHAAKIVVEDGSSVPPESTAWADVLRQNPLDEAAEEAFGSIGPDTIAKLLFTSGSTGAPKAVITTHRMLLSNQQQLRQVWPFLQEHVPVLVDWLPWSHTFGGSHNFNLILRSGGTLYIDAGRPVAQRFSQTLANLREVAPTLYFNVPRGFDMLLPVLRDNHEFRRHFFSRLELLCCAAAALPPHVWEAFKTLSADIGRTGRPIPFVAAWGSTETAPLATSCHFEAANAGVIGLPVPGVGLKLLPRGPKFEVRVKGPNVMPGYWQRPELTAGAFDEEGYYLMGDAVRPVEPGHFELGLLFDGRVAEDFKLSSGTWVNAGAVRLRSIGALAPLVQDVVVTGHDRDWLGLLLFPNIQACRELCGDLSQQVSVAEVLAHPRLRERIRAGLIGLRQQGAGSSTYAFRALLMEEPASIDAGEITDKGYINQRLVLERRAPLVEALYSAAPREDRVEIDGR